jgi:outer membrane receptor protein involved in Fe transport
MKTNSIKSKISQPSMLAAAISAVLAGTGIPAAYAQDQGAGNAGPEEVVVTGSRIQRRDFSSNSPIMTVSEDTFQESSTIAMESVLNQLPQFVPAITQFQPVPPGGLSDSGDASMTPTAASVSLRGLGANRNLVLINGRRGMPVDASMAVDINSIPSAAIARVETITGGASSVYGADAVAGVVNFILKDDFEGIDLDAQYGATQEGDGVEQSISALFGAGIGNNGNVMLGLEHYQRSNVWQKDRDFFTNGWADTGSQGGIQVFYTAPYINIATANPADQAVVDSIFTQGGVTNTGNFYLNNDGSVYQTGPAGNYRYNGPTKTADGKTYRFVRDDNGNLSENWVDQQESAPATRTSLFGSAKYEISDTLSVFGQAMFSDTGGVYRRRVGGMVGGWGGSVPHGNDIYAPSLQSDGVTTNLDYLPGGRFGLNCPATGGCTKSQVWPMSPEANALLDSRADPEAPVDVGIATTWFGNVRNSVDVRSYQLVFGVDGALKNDWTWEAYVSDGTSLIDNEYIGTTSTQRWRYVINQPNYGAGLFAQGNAEGDGFGAGSLSCTSGFSTLGQGERYYLEATGYQTELPSEDCLKATGASLAAQSTMKQRVAEFNLSGNAWELPAGELGFAFGLSTRRNEYRFLPPPLNTPESIFDLPAGQYPRGVTEGEISTKEAYGELLVPVLSELPAAEHLNLELGYRYSDNDPSNSTSSYKGLIDWQINNRFRIRGGSQVANRAPNIAELYRAADNVLLVRFNGDWCSDRNPVNPLSPNPALNPNAAQARAVCEAIMGEQGAIEYYSDANRPNQSLQYFFPYVSGNPDLQEEQARTTTLGLVADLTEAITLTVDYWNIKIDDMIATEDPDAVYRSCLSPETNPTFDPTFVSCQQISRNPSTGGEGNTTLLYTNEGSVDFAGYDISFNWRKPIARGTFNLDTQLTLTDKTKTRVDASLPWNDWKGTSGPSDIIGLNGYAYDWRSFVTATYSQSAWSVVMRWRHLPPIASQGKGLPGNTDRDTGSYDIFNVSGRYGFKDNLDLRFGIDNLFNVDPELTFANDTNTATGMTNTNFYDILGRRFYVGLNMRF